MRKIIVTDFNPHWKIEFISLKQKFVENMSHLNIDIQHVGSTSVSGLSAKPIIDLDIIVNSNKDKLEVIEILKSLGYYHMGEMGIVGREAFKRTRDDVPFNDGQKRDFSHNLYVCQKGCISLENHLRFRDYLRKNPDSVKEYGDLKQKLAIKFSNDIDSYVEAKTEFITRILEITGIKRDDLADIAEQNKKK